jgi:hypothetical protein
MDCRAGSLIPPSPANAIMFEAGSAILPHSFHFTVKLHAAAGPWATIRIW